MFIVTVEFSVPAAAMEGFLPLMLANARLSLEHEPGCRTFDVSVASEGAGSIFLYEVYDDRPAFKAHLESRHFKDFDLATRAMVSQKLVRTWAPAVAAATSAGVIR
jgi:autoinducer 2-degrading protein